MNEYPTIDGEKPGLLREVGSDYDEYVPRTHTCRAIYDFAGRHGFKLTIHPVYDNYALPKEPSDLETEDPEGELQWDVFIETANDPLDVAGDFDGPFDSVSAAVDTVDSWLP